jgi:hypothetical protein
MNHFRHPNFLVKKESMPFPAVHNASSRVSHNFAPMNWTRDATERRQVQTWFFGQTGTF